MSANDPKRTCLIEVLDDEGGIDMSADAIIAVWGEVQAFS
jgi:hypothetical protein